MVEGILPRLEEMGVAVCAVGKGPYPAGVASLESLLAGASDEPVPSHLASPRSLSDTCLYIFTSGTTGGHPAHVRRRAYATLRSFPRSKLLPSAAVHPFRLVLRQHSYLGSTSRGWQRVLPPRNRS